MRETTGRREVLGCCSCHHTACQRMMARGGGSDMPRCELERAGEREARTTGALDAPAPVSPGLLSFLLCFLISFR